MVHTINTRFEYKHEYVYLPVYQCSSLQCKVLSGRRTSGSSTHPTSCLMTNTYFERIWICVCVYVCVCIPICMCVHVGRCAYTCVHMRTTISHCRVIHVTWHLLIHLISHELCFHFASPYNASCYPEQGSI